MEASRPSGNDIAAHAVPRVRRCVPDRSGTSTRTRSAIAIPVALRNVLLRLAELLLDLALHLLRAALDVLVAVIDGVADAAANLPFELLSRTFDAVLRALTVQVIAIGHVASGAAV